MLPFNWKNKIFMGSLFFHRLFARKLGKDIYVINTSRYRLTNYEPREATLELISREINCYGVEENAAELGVYQGGFAKMINHFLPDKKLYLFDTFEGLLKGTKIFLVRHLIFPGHQKSLYCRKWSIPKTA